MENIMKMDSRWRVNSRNTKITKISIAIAIMTIVIERNIEFAATQLW